MDEQDEEACKSIGVVRWRGQNAQRVFFSANKEQGTAFNRRLALREPLMKVWNVDTHQALRMCGDRQAAAKPLS